MLRPIVPDHLLSAVDHFPAAFPVACCSRWNFPRFESDNESRFQDSACPAIS